MRRMVLGTWFLVLGALVLASCGGGSSSATSGGTGGTDDGGGTGGAGEASVASLSSVPSADLSTLDQSTSTDANLALLISGKSLSKGLGENLNAVGNSSRAGCEANMHKKEIFRMGLQSQLDRCYPEAMEAVGLITIPADDYAIYSITPPERNDEDQGQMCDGIPEERVEEREACEGGEGPGKEGILLRLGRFDNELRVDMCEGTSLVNESTYDANEAIYTIGIVRIGNWGGKAEGASFDIIVDLGTDGSVTEGIVDLGTDGTASATGHMDGGFGEGVLHFEAFGSDGSNLASGVFNGGFEDPFTGVETTFTGKTYARFGGETATGCAKFSFAGAPPPMRLRDMVPFDIAEDQLASFLQNFGIELGIDITAENYQEINLCPNPLFDPQNSDPALVKPMVLAGEEGCGQE